MSEEEELARAAEEEEVEKECYENGVNGWEVRDPADFGADLDEVRRAAGVLARVAPKIFKGLCDRCCTVLQQRLSGLSLSGELPASPSKEKSKVLSTVGDQDEDRTSCNSSNPGTTGHSEKRLWSEEQSSSSDDDEEVQPYEENQASESALSSPLVTFTEIKTSTAEEAKDTSESGPAGLSFHNEKFDFAWANVTLQSPRAEDKLDSHQRPSKGGLVNQVASPSPVAYVEAVQRGSMVCDAATLRKLGLSPLERENPAKLQGAGTPRNGFPLDHDAGTPTAQFEGAGTPRKVSPLDNVTETPSKRLLSPQEREVLRLVQVERKKDFVCMERVRGKLVNVAEGLELHMKLFSKKEQERLVDFVYDCQKRGREGLLRGRTYSEPRKWMRGKGRITIQFGCCYNYAVDKNGNPPGIMYDEQVDPLPGVLKASIRRLVKWHVLPPSCVPDSCIINIYDEGDCIPPHIDHHDFVRPFCTLSLLSECNIVFGSNLSIVGPGDFDGPLSIPLPVGSVLVLQGKGADVAKHAVPAVPTRRISITFRRMDPLRVPRGYDFPEDLKDIKALPRTEQNAP